MTECTGDLAPGAGVGPGGPDRSAGHGAADPAAAHLAAEPGGAYEAAGPATAYTTGDPATAYTTGDPATAYTTGDPGTTDVLGGAGAQEVVARDDTALARRRRGGRRAGRGPDRPRSSRRLAPRREGTRRFVVLGGGSNGTDIVAFDVDSRVLVRLGGGLPVQPDGTVQPFDVVDGTVSRHGALDDPARPEALLIAGQLERAGVARGRRARRALRGAVAPPEPHLLGFPGSSWPYWEFRGMRPSVAVVTPSRGPMLFLRAEDGTAWARFGWYRTDNWLPVHDPVAAQALADAGRTRLVGKTLVAALGFRPAYLVVAVGHPNDGYCTKQLLALLPRP